MGACQGALVAYTVGIHGLPRKISTSTGRNSALDSTVEAGTCLNAWLSLLVALFYLSKRDDRILKLAIFATRCEDRLPCDRERCIL